MGVWLKGPLILFDTLALNGRLADTCFGYSLGYFGFVWLLIIGGLYVVFGSGSGSVFLSFV